MQQSTIVPVVVKTGEPGCSLCGGLGVCPDPFADCLTPGSMPCPCVDQGHSDSGVSTRMRLAALRAEVEQCAAAWSVGDRPEQRARGSAYSHVLSLLNDAGL